jgi:hypothetical protein
VWWQISHRFESENQSLKKKLLEVRFYQSPPSNSQKWKICGLGNFLLLFLMKVESLRIAVDIENRDLARHSKTEHKETYLIST